MLSKFHCTEPLAIAASFPSSFPFWLQVDPNLKKGTVDTVLAFEILRSCLLNVVSNYGSVWITDP